MISIDVGTIGLLRAWQGDQPDLALYVRPR